MADYIDRQAATNAVCNLPTWYGDEGCLPFGEPQPPMEALMYPEDVVSAINNLPSADVKLVVHGKWHDCYELIDGTFVGTCSACGKIKKSLYPVMDKYCAECGATMDADIRGNAND